MTLHGHEPERPPVRPEAAVAHFDVAGTDCERCPTLIGRVLSRVGGVHLAVDSLGTETAVVTYDPRFTYPNALLQAVATAPSIGRRRLAATVRRIGPPDRGDACRSAPRGGSAEDVVPGDTVPQTGHPALEGGAAQELWQLVSGLQATPTVVRAVARHPRCPEPEPLRRRLASDETRPR